MARHDQIEAADGERQLLRVALFEPHREALRGRLFARLGEHLRREIDAGHAVAAARQFEAQKPGAATDIERIEACTPAEHNIEDAVPGGALGGGANAVPEIGVEPGRPPVPMRRDLLFDLILLCRWHAPDSDSKLSRQRLDNGRASFETPASS